MILKKEIFRDDYILRVYKIIGKIDRELEHLNLNVARKYQQLGVLGVFNLGISELDLQVETVMGNSFLERMKDHLTVKRAFQECHFELLKLNRKWNYFLQKKVIYQNQEYPVYDMIFMNITEEEFRECVLGKTKGYLLKNVLKSMEEFLVGIQNDFLISNKKEKSTLQELGIREYLRQWNLEDAQENDLDVSTDVFSYERKKTS